jgi:PAS domain S-box-containing protein
MSKLRILYLEDAKYDVDIIREHLEQENIDFHLIHAENKEEYIKSLQNNDLDIILADFSLPSLDGLEALSLTQQLHPDIPFIIVSGVMGEELAIEALKSGATDYVLKQRLGRLIPSIRRAMLEGNERRERKMAVNEKHKYDFIVNASKSMFTLIDRSFKYEAVNDAFCKAHDLVRDEIIGKTLVELWGEDSFNKHIRDSFDKSFSDNIVRYQAWFEVPSHGLRCFEVTFYPYKEHGSDVTHTVVDTMDITDKQKAEDALRDSEARYRMLFDHATEAILLEKDNRIQTFNSSVIDFFGYSKKAILDKSLFDLSVTTQPDGINSKEKATELMEAAAKGDPLEFKWEFERKDKSTFKADVSLASFSLKGEHFYQYFVHDVTERARIEENNAHLAEAMEQSAELISIMDFEGQLIYVNAAYSEKTGFPGEELMGSLYSLTLPEEFTEDRLLKLKESIMKHNGWSGEMDLVTRERKILKVFTRISPVRNTHYEVTSFVSVMRDITEESRMKSYLRQAQKMETIGTLAGGIAHDFNNIIATIMGHADIALQDVKVEHPAYEDLEQIMKATHRAKGLVDQILTFSRQVEIKPEEVNLVGLTKEAIKLLGASVPENIQILQETEMTCNGVMADPSQLHQVIMNICTNAIYALKDNGGSLKITSDSIAPGEDLQARYPNLNADQYSCLKFQDTGMGMDQVTLDRIFEPFFTTKPVGEGTGLGLSVVHGIIKSLNGEIIAESSPGKGTSITVMLPCIN